MQWKIQHSPIRWLFLFSFIPFILWSQLPDKLNTLDPFFSYSTDEWAAMRSVPLSTQPLVQEKFEQWDPSLYEITNHPQLDGQTTRLMAYLYVAQRDFALLVYSIAQQWVGNPDSLVINIIRLFSPNFQSSYPIQKDLFSEKIGEIVFRKIEARLKHEEANLKNYPPKEGSGYWKETPPYIGQRIGTCQPWFLTSLKDVQAPPPPNPDSIIWAYGIQQILVEQAHLTPMQRQLISYWAGEKGPRSGDWFAIANQKLRKKDLQFQEFLFVRAILAMALTDALIAAFDSKYTYWIPRPYMLDPTVIQIVICPKHPSYPSAHSVSSACAATILSHFFPHDKQRWQKLAFEAGNTRIWAGLHYMYDNEQGLIQGEKVGNIVIERLASSIPKQ